MGSSRPKILGAYLTERLSVYDCPRELWRGLFRTLWCGAKRTSWCWRSTRSRRASRKRKLTAWRYKCDEQQSRFRPTSPKDFVGVASVVTQNRPMRVTSKPANEKARDIDSDGSPYRLLRYEQSLERSEETTSFGTREARMALATHRASHWCTSSNSRRLPEGGGDRGTTTGRLGTASAAQTGQRGDHRPRRGKSSREGDRHPRSGKN